jgi:hypothetical protein
MRNIALLISLIGIFALIVIQTFSPHIQINSIGEFSSLSVNEKVVIFGKPTNQRFYQSYTYFEINGIIIHSKEKLLFSVNNITVYGKLKEYKDKKYIQSDKITLN